MSARVITAQNLSPDFIQTILRDAQREVVAGARKLGINPDLAAEAAALDDDNKD